MNDVGATRPKCVTLVINFNVLEEAFILPNSDICDSLASRVEIASWLAASDCNPGIEFSIPGSGIEKFVIPGSHFGIRLSKWSLFWYP